MVKINMRKIKETTEQLKDENDLIERRYRSITCCTFLCSNPATHLLVTGLGCYPNYHESLLCNMCSDSIQKLSDYQWDVRGIIDVYKLM